MAFNLNKNEANNPSTKFDLSKSNSSTGVSTAQGKNKPRTWLFALLGLLVIGIGAWYFLSRPNDISKNENDVAAAATGSDSANISPGGNQNKAAATPVDTTGNVKTENETNLTASPKKDTTDAIPGKNTGSRAASVSGTSINNKVPATFAKGSNSISALDESLVKEIIAFLEKNPGSIINVNGYASSEGTLAVNQTISQSRADAFKRYLASKGISTNRINATGKGVDNPISSNNTEEGRIKNRRVEISLQ